MENQTSNQVHVNISMNSYAFLVGVPIMILLTIFASVFIYSWNAKTPQVIVESSQTKVDANITNNIPQQPPPIVHTADNIINVPESKPNVTVHNVVKPSDTAVSVQVPESVGKNGPTVVERTITKEIKVPVPVYIETKEFGAVTISDIYTSVESFMRKWHNKNGLNYESEYTKWLKRWESRIPENGGDEQRLANSELMNIFSGFDVNSITPDKLVGIGRIFLRYRDARLALPDIFKQYVTADNLVKLKEYIDTQVVAMGGK